MPNGNILVASNRSKGWARAIVDVRASYGEDVEHLRDVLEELFRELEGDRTFSEWIHEAPSVLGVERMGQDALVMRVIADTRPSKVMDVERLLRERISRRLTEKGIKVPVYPVAPTSLGHRRALGVLASLVEHQRLPGFEPDELLHLFPVPVLGPFR